MFEKVILVLGILGGLAGVVAFLAYTVNGVKWLTAICSGDAGQSLAGMFLKAFRKSPFVYWFTARETAKPEMITNLAKFSHISFFGVSHRRLAGYLADAVNEHRQTKVPWEKIDIYFASPEIGKLWEGNDFPDAMRHNRHKIADVLTSQTTKEVAPKLKEVNFFEYPKFLGYTGTLLSQVDEDQSEVMYVVHSLPSRRGELKQSLTFRIDTNNILIAVRKHKSIVEHYRETLNSLKQQSRRIGTVVPNLWDQSAAAWNEFCQTETYSETIDELVRFLEIGRKKESVLDIGSGTGFAMSSLLSKSKKVHQVTLLDSSPQMLNFAKSKLGGEPRIKYALGTLPPKFGDDFDVGREKFTTILIHRSIRTLVSTNSDLRYIAEWCNKHLEENGRIVVAGHNGDISIDVPVVWKKWLDPLPAAFEKVIGHEELQDYQRHRNRHSPIATDEIKKAFEQTGLICDKEHSCDFKFTMEQREIMWSVPAIMDCELEVKKAGISKSLQIVNSAFEEIRREPTKDVSMIYLQFTRS